MDGEILDYGVDHNIIEKSGTWFSYKDERMGQGRENSRTWLKEHPEEMAYIRRQVMIKAGIIKVDAEPAKQAKPQQADADVAAAAGARKPVAKAATVKK